MANPEKMTVEKCKDSGLALVLLCLIGSLFRPGPLFPGLAVLFLVAAMTAPIVFQPFARFWFGLSAVLGAVVSRVVLTVLYALLVLPVGLARRLMGKDAMQLKSWKQGKSSVFRARNREYSAQDLEHPY